MGVLTEAGSVPAVVVLGAAGDTVVAQQPITCHFAPQADAADARLEVSGAALTVWAAPCSEQTRAQSTLCNSAFTTTESETNSCKFNSFRPSVAL